MPTENIKNIKNDKNKKLLTMFLAVIMILGCFAAIPGLSITALAAAAAADEAVTIQDYTTIVYKNVDEKLAAFGEWVEVGEGKKITLEPNGKPTLVKNGYELYYQYETGEVAVKDTRTGQVLLSNPYDVGSSTASAATKENLLSQILIKYTDDTGKQADFSTYKQAAMNKQIKMKPIKGGIRVEYTIGKEEKRKLVPRIIEKSSFEDNIRQYVTNERELAKLDAYYTLKDAQAPDLTERARKELQVTYPITKFMAIYVFDPNASERELTQIEGYIKQYTKYTFEMMDADHQLVEYTAKDKAPPLFKMALEYYIDEDGLYMRLPASGIRFDESTYKLSYINVLPYMGAGKRGNTGYTFIPDGSGALVRYEDIGSTDFTLTNKIYGPDYSFYKIGLAGWTQAWRLPVFGAVENFTISRDIVTEEIKPSYTEIQTDTDGNEVEVVIPEETISTTTVEKEDRSDGFLAIIEEGDAMAQLSTDHGGGLHEYNCASAQFTPRPTDEYNLDFETKGISSLILVASRRKYSGNYIIRYVMLSSDENGNPKNKNGGYAASYVGMAMAYRDYLVKRGQLTQLQDDGKDIPLYLETLGDIWTPENFLGFPYFGRTALTSFDNIKSMIDELNGEGITNLNFRLRGWANDGVRSAVPIKLKIDKALGGKKGFDDVLTYAKTKNATIYPNVDIALVNFWKMFDGFKPKKDIARYMDGKMASEQKYFFLAQDFFRFNSSGIITPSSMERIYKGAMKEYNKYNVGAISVDTLAKELHSDQYRKHLINRAESKEYVTNLFEEIKTDHGNVLADEANAYSFKYLNAILNIPLDSSRFNKESESIPFYGMVTHGFMDIAGTPINMSGDFKYDLLKAIENGSNPYFIISYQNTNRIKENDLYDSYYSVDYTNWLNDILSTYKTLNDALKPVRAKLIINHEFLAKNIVKVTYEGGTAFILNYNNKDVTVDGHDLGPLEFVKVS